MLPSTIAEGTLPSYIALSLHHIHCAFDFIAHIGVYSDYIGKYTASISNVLGDSRGMTAWVRANLKRAARLAEFELIARLQQHVYQTSTAMLLN